MIDDAISAPLQRNDDHIGAFENNASSVQEIVAMNGHFAAAYPQS
jgi:hypothetical protein